MNWLRLGAQIRLSNRRKVENDRWREVDHKMIGKFESELVKIIVLRSGF